MRTALATTQSVHLYTRTFPQHEDWAELAEEQKVPRLDPTTLAEEDAWSDVTDSPADPKQHSAWFCLQGKLGF